MNIKMTGIALAIGAAAMFSLAPVVATASSAVVKCEGVNTCKGHGSCKTAKNACKGHNSCKGEGIVKMTKHQCEQIGGKEG